MDKPTVVKIRFSEEPDRDIKDSAALASLTDQGWTCAAWYMEEMHDDDSGLPKWREMHFVMFPPPARAADIKVEVVEFEVAKRDALIKWAAIVVLGTLAFLGGMFAAAQ